MVVYFKKGTSVFISENYKSDQFDCKCTDPKCISTAIHEELIAGLEKLCESVGEVLTVNSAFRCEKHNAAEGGAPKSQHLKGKAVDLVGFKCSSDELVKHARDVKCFKGIGKGKTLVHLDVREKPAYWEYPMKKSPKVG
jgi:uncharacterized protein YcbK (DUF882 family)